MDSVLIDENELSRRTSIKATTLQKWRATGEGPPYVKLGRLCRYRWEDVEAWLKERERTAIAQKESPSPDRHGRASAARPGHPVVACPRDGETQP